MQKNVKPLMQEKTQDRTLQWKGIKEREEEMVKHLEAFHKYWLLDSLSSQ